MRKFIVAAGLLAATLGPWSAAGAAAQTDGWPCWPNGGIGCVPAPPLHLAVAALPGTPLIWSATHADLEPPRIRREAIVLGHTIPIDEVIGRQVRLIGKVPLPTMYNRPTGELAADDPSLVLVPVSLGRRGTLLRRAD